jgi:hypothetical protein
MSTQRPPHSPSWPLYAEQAPNSLSKPLAHSRPLTSTPLLEVVVYRPGPYLALAVVLLPVVITLAGALIAFSADGQVPVWLPFVLLLWVPCLPLVWRTLRTVRTDTIGIAAGRPWQRWREVPWTAVERVEQHGWTIRIRAGSGVEISFQPLLLRDGRKLTRQLLLRLPAHVLMGRLGQDAQKLLVTGVYAMPEGGLSGTLHARPRPLWRFISAAVAVLGALLCAGALLALPPLLGVPLGLLAVALTVAALVIFVWLWQALLVNEHGLSVAWTLTRRTRGIGWQEIGLVEHSNGEAVLRIRGDERILCAGPGLFNRAQHDLMRAFLHEYCVSRGVPFVRRNWLFH